MLKVPTFPTMAVLLVDDSAFARRTIRGMLEPVGLRYVIECRDGAEALVRLTQFRPGLIVLDWNLPVLSAANLLDVIRDPNRSTDARVPVIIMSAAPTQRVVAQAAARNVKTVLRKPFAPKALWQRIQHFYPASDSRRTLEDSSGLLSPPRIAAAR